MENGLYCIRVVRFLLGFPSPLNGELMDFLSLKNTMAGTAGTLITMHIIFRGLPKYEV